MRWTEGLVVMAVQSMLSSGAWAQEPDGCYDVTLGAWAAIDSTHTASWPRPAPPDISGDSVYYTLPSRLQLLLDPPWDGAPAEVHRLGVPDDVLQVPHSQLTWQGGADSLSFGVSTGLVGTISRLARRGSEWVGWTETFSDVGGLLRYRRSIRLTHVDCSAPPPIPASLDRPLLRGFEFQAVGLLELGDTIPAGVGTLPRRSGAMTLQLQAADLWAGADAVVVRVGRSGVLQGSLQHIELRYPEGHDLAVAVGDLVRRFGSGTEPLGSGTIFWQNRTTTLFISPSGRRPRVVVMDPRGR